MKRNSRRFGTLNIALVCQWYLPEDWGGVAVSVHALAIGLRECSHDVTVVTSTLEQSLVNTERHEDGIRVIRIRRPEWPWFVRRLPAIGPHMTSLRLFFYNLRLIRKLQQIVNRLKIDIVEYVDVNGEGAFHTWLLPRIPYVVRLQTPLFIAKRFYTQSERGDSYLLAGWMEKRAIRNASRLISPSQSMANIISEACQIPLEKIKLIANPLDPEYLDSKPIPNQFHFPFHTVLYMGRLEKRKGVFVFAEAIPKVLKEFPDAYFVFAGPDRHSPTGGSSQKEVEKYLARENVRADRFSFLGQVPRSKLRSCYGESSVVVIPSLYEDYPYSVVEAMACGAPVVASNCYGIPEIISHERTGLLFKPEDSANLADKILNFLKDPARRKQIAERGQAFIREHCSPNRIGVLTTKLYEEVMT